MTENISIAAVMSLPRLGWNDSWGCVHEALDPFRIPVRRFSGVFWGQCMTRAMEELVAEGIDWMLAIDYDSMFTAIHVDQMLGILGNNPHIDALAPLQTKRQEKSPLLSIRDANEITFKFGEPFEVDTAHFGLTLIRVDAIKNTPAPWFQAFPDADNRWGENRIDEDIHFWRQFKAGGNRVFITPDVRIGHLEVVCSEFDLIHQTGPDGKTECDLRYQQISVNKWKDRERERLRSAQSVSAGRQPVPQGDDAVPSRGGGESLDRAGIRETVAVA